MSASDPVFQHLLNYSFPTLAVPCQFLLITKPLSKYYLVIAGLTPSASSESLFEMWNFGSHWVGSAVSQDPQVSCLYIWIWEALLHLDSSLRCCGLANSDNTNITTKSGTAGWFPVQSDIVEESFLQQIRDDLSNLMTHMAPSPTHLPTSFV